jgi:hypothetical protein
MSSDPEKGSAPDSRSAIDLPCAPPDKPVRERLGEPVPPEGEFCVFQGRPCIWFRSWDYAEDWSGEFVRVVQPDSLSGASHLSGTEFWALVRRVQGIAT